MYKLNHLKSIVNIMKSTVQCLWLLGASLSLLWFSAASVTKLLTHLYPTLKLFKFRNWFCH